MTTLNDGPENTLSHEEADAIRALMRTRGLGAMARDCGSSEEVLIRALALLPCRKRAITNFRKKLLGKQVSE